LRGTVAVATFGRRRALSLSLLLFCRTKIALGSDQREKKDSLSLSEERQTEAAHANQQIVNEKWNRKSKQRNSAPLSQHPKTKHKSKIKHCIGFFAAGIVFSYELK